MEKLFNETSTQTDESDDVKVANTSQTSSEKKFFICPPAYIYRASPEWGNDEVDFINPRL
jgi:hypothetical protein